MSGSVVTVNLRPGAGVNTLALASTGITCTGSSFASGVAPVNALYLAPAVAGVVGKPVNVVWSFTGLSVGTAGWFRFYSSNASDTGALVSGAPYYPRLDGAIATSGGDLNLSNISIVVAAPTTIDTFNLTVPAQ